MTSNMGYSICHTAMALTYFVSYFCVIDSGPSLRSFSVAFYILFLQYSMSLKFIFKRYAPSMLITSKNHNGT